MNISILNELKPLAPVENLSDAEPTLEVSLIIPAKNAAFSLETTVQQAHVFLSLRYGESFEIILVPNPDPAFPEDRSPELALALAEKFPSVRVFMNHAPRGKGASVRLGFLNSRGRRIFFTDADLPYDLDFFDEAVKKLDQGFDLVTGNRRLPMSHFSIPVKLLRVAYGRHRLGLAFNRLVRLLLPISTSDTQAGIKALSRRLALEAFSKQQCPGFLFDLEIFLTAHARGYSRAELPVTLYLNSEKSTVRILRECILVGNWLTRIAWKHFHEGYGDHGPVKTQKILARYQSAPLGTRLFLSARWRLTPYSQMESRLPMRGRILDLGCGHGLFALAAALRSPERKILGVDHDTARVKLAQSATQDLPNINLESGSMTSPPSEQTPYSGIAMIDVMHYFDHETQKELLHWAFQALEDGGTLLVREVEPKSGIASTWNRYYEKLATGIGFTRSEKTELHFRSRSEWEDVLKEAGFRVHSERCSSPLFADILYVCERSR